MLTYIYKFMAKYQEKYNIYKNLCEKENCKCNAYHRYKRMCRYGINCKNKKKCRFKHPVCKFQNRCNNPRCKFIHFINSEEKNEEKNEEEVYIDSDEEDEVNDEDINFVKISADAENKLKKIKKTSYIQKKGEELKSNSFNFKEDNEGDSDRKIRAAEIISSSYSSLDLKDKNILDLLKSGSFSKNIKWICSKDMLLKMREKRDDGWYWKATKKLWKDSNIKYDSKVSVVMKYENMLLVVQNYCTKWGFPGGKIEDFDKNILDTATREIYEELGISIDLKGRELNIKEKKIYMKKNFYIDFHIEREEFERLFTSVPKIGEDIEITGIAFVKKSDVNFRNKIPDLINTKFFTDRSFKDISERGFNNTFRNFFLK